jgi:hypothetical protein
VLAARTPDPWDLLAWSEVQVHSYAGLCRQAIYKTRIVFPLAHGRHRRLLEHVQRRSADNGDVFNYPARRDGYFKVNGACDPIALGCGRIVRGYAMNEFGFANHRRRFA